MKIVCLATALVLTSFAHGQDASCPVRVTQVNVETAPQRMSYATFRNVATQPIEALKFNVVYLDKTQDEHPSYGDVSTQGGMKPGKTVNAGWNASYIDYSQGGGGYIIRVDKVLFKDGTAWLPPKDGENPCQYKKVVSSYVMSPY